MNLSDLIFVDVLGMLQMLAPMQVALALPTTYDVFFTALAKAALPPPIIAVLDELQQASLHSSSHLRHSRLVWQEVVKVAPHHSHWDLARTN
jgi:hypothetical protein